MTITHEISEPFLSHVAESLQRIARADATAMQLRGQVALLERDAATFRQYLSIALGLLEKQSELPPSKTPYALSEDGKFLVGEVADALPIAEGKT